MGKGMPQKNVKSKEYNRRGHSLEEADVLQRSGTAEEGG
jgi:hypothetical protein